MTSQEALRRTDLNGQTPVHLAAATGFLEALEFFASSPDFGLDVNAQMHNRVTPLHLAALFGHTNTCRFLVSAGARVNHQDRNGTTALMMAAYAGHLEVVSLLIQSDADMSIQDKFKNSALLLAFLQGHFDLAPLLSDGSVPLGDISNALGDSPIWGVVLHHKKLLASGTTPTKLDQYLSEIGASALNQLRGKHDLNILHRTLIQLDPESCETLVPILVRHGADVQAASGDKKTPLHYACRFGHLGVIRFLLSQIPPLALDSMLDASLNSPLHLAVIHSPQSAQIILDTYAKHHPPSALKSFINKPNQQGNTSLHFALSFQIYTAVQTLIQSGGELTIRNHNGNLPKDCIWAITKSLFPVYPDDESILSSAGLYISKVSVVD